MIKETASSTNMQGTNCGSARWISSTEISPQSKKSRTWSTPVRSALNVAATAWATGSSFSMDKTSEPCLFAFSSTCSGTGNTGKLKGTRSKPSQKARQLTVGLGVRWPSSTALTAAKEGTWIALTTSLRSLGLSSSGQAPISSMAWPSCSSVSPMASLRARALAERLRAEPTGTAEGRPEEAARVVINASNATARSDAWQSTSKEKRSCRASSNRRRPVCTRFFS
mmetsp:Transcript_106033/g.304889  ORF Transcript_106033/g.304889 Transcript_106033/m.304889 type:complete len:225 (+) Transcript_106033:919-1593(+)